MNFTTQDEINKLLEWCKGDQSAAQFLMSMGIISQLADDIADGDVDSSPQNIAKLLHMVMVELPSNPFYLKNTNAFIPLFSTSLHFWSNSDAWGKTDKAEYGYVYREILEQVVTMTATILGGWEHANKVTNEIVHFYHQGKSFDEWKQEMNQ